MRKPVLLMAAALLAAGCGTMPAAQSATCTEEVTQLARQYGLSTELPFVVPRAEAPWIMAPVPVSAALMQWGEARAPVTSFTRRFEAADEPGRLRIRTLGDARVFVNGRELASLARRGRRGVAEAEIDVGGALAPGLNELRIDVSNRMGPGLLSVAGPRLLATGAAWWVAVEGGRPAAAVPADDTRRNPLALAVETPADALRRHGDALLACFVLGAGISWLAQRQRRGVRLAEWLDLVAPVLASAAWLYVFGAKLWRIPLAVGFDARHHVAFAHGPHVCLGMHLARIEARAAMGLLLARLPALRLDPERPAAPRGLVFRKPPALHALWEAAAAA